MNDINDEADWLLARVMQGLGDSGIPVDETIATSGASQEAQDLVWERLAQKAAGVRS